MAKTFPVAETVKFNISPSDITGYKLETFRDQSGNVGERLEITYVGRDNVKFISKDSVGSMLEAVDGKPDTE